MKIHEYQAKAVLASFGVAVPRGTLATTPEEARVAAQGLGGSVWVVKAQVHAGGRGKGGGIKVAKSLDEVRDKAAAVIGMTLVTPQTGPEGRLVRKVYIEEGLAIAREHGEPYGLAWLGIAVIAASGIGNALLSAHEVKRNTGPAANAVATD